MTKDSAPAAACGMGVQEMTRFGMKEKDFPELAGYIAEVDPEKPSGSR